MRVFFNRSAELGRVLKRGLWYLRQQPFYTSSVPHLKDRATQYWLLMRFDKPIGIYLLLWPTLWALWIAGEGHPDAKVFTVFVLGVIVMRAAGCVINDYADRKYDKRVERTKTRPLATGKVSPKEAIALFAALIAIAFILVLQMNELTIYLSFGGLFLAVLYPFMKRFTYLPQPVLGAAFGWAVPMAFAAQTGTLPDVAWLLFIATVLWATAYDTMYAMVDIKDDLKIGVRSTAILFGEQDRLIIGILQLTLLFNLIVIGKQSNFGTTYYLSCFLAAGLAVYQQYLIRHRDRERCFQAFLNNHWFGMIIFIGIVLHYAFNQKVISS